MACPSRESCAAAVLALIVLAAIVSIPVVLIGGVIVVHRVSVSVVDASLSTFAVATLTPMANSTPAPPAPLATTTAAAAVSYNLSMTVNVHNPNWFLGVRFAAPLELRYSFDGVLFGPLVELGGEGDKLHAGYTWVYGLTTGAVGQIVPLGVDGVADFARQSSVGVFELDVLVAGNYTVRGAKRSLAATCALKLPLGAPPASFKKVKCV